MANYHQANLSLHPFKPCENAHSTFKIPAGLLCLSSPGAIGKQLLLRELHYSQTYENSTSNRIVKGPALGENPIVDVPPHYLFFPSLIFSGS